MTDAKWRGALRDTVTQIAMLLESSAPPTVWGRGFHLQHARNQRNHVAREKD